MPAYYCHACVRELGLIKPVDPTLLPSSEHLLEKFMKHTAPSVAYRINSVFPATSLAEYQDYMVTTNASGCMEIDDRGRKNLIFFAGRQTGLKFEDGLFTTNCSGVKVVYAEDQDRIHAFPSDFLPDSRNCVHCGRLVPFDPSTSV